MTYQFIAADYLDEIVSNAAHRGNATLAGDFEVTTSDTIEYELRSNAFTKYAASEVGSNGVTRPDGSDAEAFIAIMDVYEKIDDLSENVFDAIDGQIEVIWDEDAVTLYREYPGDIDDYFSARVDTDRFSSFTDALAEATGCDPNKIDSALREPVEGLGRYERLIDALRFCANVFAEQVAADTFEDAIRYIADRVSEASESTGAQS